ncbi:N-terminal domain of NEFA-interacting nuclear protein NIP30-domain-containing protein [Syncephalastrum racemosum]|uniref:N-terminal domain of NEFA-interacting nuclear protein NIP30-domain-containing protein n=1 Tax=Syncephalastrum racemosum TaxID=13706 RepID=A0A1X2HS49_SYNRA|nr:N-terminal domain of NEFA-interacting nuclear protein NIP30-domain-containing protein [Syncephalastrum racemosum]
MSQSGRFVSGQTLDPTKGDQDDAEAASSSTSAEPYDPRTLYERLQEQRHIKEEMFQEQSRLSNLIKRVDDDEAEYFQTLSDVQRKLEEEQRQKEQEELDAYRKAVVSGGPQTSPPTVEKPTTSQFNKKVLPRKSTAKPTKGLEGLVVVKRKREQEDEEKDETSKKAKSTATTAATSTTTTTTTTTTTIKTAATAAKPAEKKSEPKPQPATSLVAAYSDDSSSEDDA